MSADVLAAAFWACCVLLLLLIGSGMERWCSGLVERVCARIGLGDPRYDAPWADREPGDFGGRDS